MIREVKKVKCINPDCQKLYPYKANKMYCSVACGAAVRNKEAQDFTYSQGSRSKTDIATGSVGAAHELIVCAALLKLGYSVFRAQSPSCPCDLVLLFKGKTFRVEVRTVTLSLGGKLNLPVGEKDKGRFDILATVRHNWEIAYYNADLQPIDIKSL